MVDHFRLLYLSEFYTRLFLLGGTSTIDLKRMEGVDKYYD